MHVPIHSKRQCNDLTFHITWICITMTAMNNQKFNLRENVPMYAYDTRNWAAMKEASKHHFMNVIKNVVQFLRRFLFTDKRQHIFNWTETLWIIWQCVNLSATKQFPWFRIACFVRSIEICEKTLPSHHNWIELIERQLWEMSRVLVWFGTAQQMSFESICCVNKSGWLRVHKVSLMCLYRPRWASQMGIMTIQYWGTVTQLPSSTCLS